MVILGRWGNRPITISVKTNCLTVSLDDPSEASVFSYDFEGRLWTAYLDGIAYRRGLDGRMMAKWRLPGGERSRTWLSPVQAAGIEERARSETEGLLRALLAQEATLNTPLPQLGINGFERAIRFDAARSNHDANRYHEIYEPVGILPPDQYMAVVLQATEGCSFNTCTFCSFYRDRPFRIKSYNEFRAHALAVKDFLGEGLSLRRTVFLADANSLVAPMRLLLPIMEIVHEVYDVGSVGGIYAFLDGFSGEKKSISDFRALAEHGLTRVYIGMESGSPVLLNFLRKPGKPADAVKAVQTMKQAGIAVGVIILLGAGGHQFEDEHVHETITALNTMPLDKNDIVYFSELMVSPDMPYSYQAAESRLIPLTHEEQMAQASRIEDGLHFSTGNSCPHLSRYDIREFVY